MIDGERIFQSSCSLCHTQGHRETWDQRSTGKLWKTAGDFHRPQIESQHGRPKRGSLEWSRKTETGWGRPRDRYSRAGRGHLARWPKADTANAGDRKEEAPSLQAEASFGEPARGGLSSWWKQLRTPGWSRNCPGRARSDRGVRIHTVSLHLLRTLQNGSLW